MPLGMNRLVGGINVRFLMDTPDNVRRFDNGTESASTLVILYAKDGCTYQSRWHLGDKKPGGYTPDGGQEEGGLSAAQVKTIVDECTAPITESVDDLSARLDAKCKEVDANTAAIAALPPEKFLTGPVDIDGQAGTGGATLNDGTVVPIAISGVPQAGDYVQTPGGDTVIPLVGGGGAITITAPPASQFTSTVAPNGDITIKHTSGDGTVTEQTFPFDEMLGGLGLAADGCTLVGTLDDGTAVSVPFCDLVSDLAVTENADGSFNVVHTSGNGDETEFVVPAPATPHPEYVDERGVVFADGDKIARNPVTGIVARDDGACLQFCDGSEKGFSVFTDITSAATAMSPTVDQVNSGTPAGKVAFTEHCFTAEVPKCGGRIVLHFYVGGSVQSHQGGDLVVTVRYSVDGGPPRSTTGAGASQYKADNLDKPDGNPATTGEYESARIAETAVLTPGEHIICSWIEVTGNNLAPGSTFGFGSFLSVATTQSIRVC